MSEEDRCIAEIEQAEALLRAGHPDIDGLVQCAADWRAELRILRGGAMKPYYDHAGITLYCGDCREILPHLPPVDLVLTDPPYPGLAGGIEHFNGGGVSKRVVFGSTTVGKHVI